MEFEKLFSHSRNIGQLFLSTQKGIKVLGVKYNIHFFPPIFMRRVVADPDMLESPILNSRIRIRLSRISRIQIPQTIPEKNSPKMTSHLF